MPETTCSNCENTISAQAAITVYSAGIRVAQLCNTCVHDVLTMKIVLKRADASLKFDYEGYLPIESAKK